VKSGGLLAAAGIAALLVAGLSGCATSGGYELGVAVANGIGDTVPTLGSAPSFVPVVKDCWQETYSEMRSWQIAPADAPVDCATPHQAITYATPILPAGLPESLLTSGNPELDPTIAAAGSSTCGELLHKILPPLTVPTRTYSTYLFPSPSQWAAGARWVRCDFLAAELGSSLYTPSLENLPTGMDAIRSTWRSTPGKFEACANDPGSSSQTGPFNNNAAVWADCTRSPQWHQFARLAIAGGIGAPYPDTATLLPFMHKNCGAKVDTAALRGWDFWPNRDQWQQGDRAFECWYGAR
jgi:hypothetical protein